MADKVGRQKKKHSGIRSSWHEQPGLIYAWGRAGVAVVLKDNSMFLLAEEDGWEVGKDCSSSSACKSEQRCIRGALCGKISKHLSALCLGTTKLFLSVQFEFLARQPFCSCKCKV